MSDKLMKKVKELEEQYSKIAEDLIDATWIIDAKTLKYEYITPSFEKVSGYETNEFTNFTLKDTLTPKAFKKIKIILADEKKKFAWGQKRLIKAELESVHKNGSIYWVEIKAKFIDKSGSPLKIIGTTKEISQQKKNEQKQDDLIKKLNDTLAEKEELLKEVKQLQELLPICSGCKRIRDEDGKWWPMDMYMAKKTKSDLTHTVCPDCLDVLYGKQYK
ncbi:MAG: PAS domain S-box protein [Calditrichia bacterium]|nr:PAS domain S-box protein [Calditrichia bacterium]